MPTLTFVDAKQTNSEKDGLDVLFVYKVDDSVETRTIHILGSENSWGMNDQEKADYTQKLFTATVAYIKDHWETYSELPDNEKQVNSQSDFPPYQPGKTAWEGYIINLVD